MTIEQSVKDTNTELVYKERIKDTPFDVVGNEETGYKIALGRFLISQAYQTPYDAECAAYAKPWDILMNVVSLVTKLTITEHEKENGVHSQS